MAAKGIENVNPQRFTKKTKREVTSEEEDESVEDPIDDREIFGNEYCMILSKERIFTSYCLYYRFT